jgi:hypothetical protein
MNQGDLDRERRARSLQELESRDWGSAPFPSHLVRSVHALRRKAIGALTVEELRLLIGQDVGLLFLVPLALERVEADPLAEGDFFTGDLLLSLVRADPSFWLRQRELRARLIAAARRALDEPEFAPQLDETTRREVAEALARLS